MTKSADLADLSQCDKILKIFGQLLVFLFRIWQRFVPALEISYATVQNFIVINGQRLENNLSIWSRDCQCDQMALYIFAKKNRKMSKEGSTFCQMLSKLSNNCQDV